MKKLLGLAVMLPAADICPPVNILPPVILPVDVINPLVIKLLPVMLPAALTLELARNLVA